VSRLEPEARRGRLTRRRRDIVGIIGEAGIVTRGISVDFAM